jgi:hypothetical protein
MREGISEIQQNDIKRRMEYSSEYIRRGMGGQIIQWQGPVTRALDNVRDKLQEAQRAMADGNQQAPGASDRERQLARIEQMRNQLERAAGRGQNQAKQGQGQQGGQQGQQGQQGGQGANQQGGGNQQGANQGGANGGNQFGGGDRFGGPNDGRFGGPGGPYGPYVRDAFGRYYPEGQYAIPDGRPVDPSQAVRDAARQLAEMRQFFRDDPEVRQQIQDLEAEIRKLTFGDTATALLAERLNRTILPQLETLEVQLRRQIAEEQSGQVRNAGTDRVPAGFAEQVAEYWRKLNKGR